MRYCETKPVYLDLEQQSRLLDLSIAPRLGWDADGNDSSYTKMSLSEGVRRALALAEPFIDAEIVRRNGEIERWRARKLQKIERKKFLARWRWEREEFGPRRPGRPRGTAARVPGSRPVKREG